MTEYSTTFKNGKTFGVVKQKNKFYYITEGKKRPIAKKNVDVISKEKREVLRKEDEKIITVNKNIDEYEKKVAKKKLAKKNPANKKATPKKKTAKKTPAKKTPKKKVTPYEKVAKKREETQKPTKNKRVSVSVLLESDDNKDVFLGVLYRLAKSVRGFVTYKQKKQRVSRQMNVISKGWKDETKEGVAKVGKMIAPFANDIMVVSPQGTKEQLKVWNKIYEIYKSYNINPNRPKSDPYKKNKQNVLDKLKNLK